MCVAPFARIWAATLVAGQGRERRPGCRGRCCVYTVLPALLALAQPLTADALSPLACLCGCLRTRVCCLCRRANAQQPKLFVGMILILIFAEALALYGLIGASCTVRALRA